MARIAYESKNFKSAALEIIEQANEILEEYDQQGFDLTLRQLFYQFVSRDLLANKQSEYKRLGSIINDARMAGYIDWDYIVDRTRNVKSSTVWKSPAHIIEAAARGYMIDVWKDQSTYVEVWIEKDALIGVIGGICEELRVPYFSCRGYVSQSEMWGAAQRIGKRLQQGKKVTILHLGDHDPSGIDMTRDIQQRMWLFMATDLYHSSSMISTANASATTTQLFEVERIALNMDQIRRYGPPPNPAKLTDSRAIDYITKYGHSSWELDALDPATLAKLIEDNVMAHVDEDEWEMAAQRERDQRDKLTEVSRNWVDVVEFVEGLDA